MSGYLSKVSTESKIFYYSPELSKEGKLELKKFIDDIASSQLKKVHEMISHDLFLTNMKLDIFQSSWDEKENTEELKEIIAVFNQNVKYCNILNEETELARKMAPIQPQTFEEFCNSTHLPGLGPTSSQYPQSQLRFFEPGSPLYKIEKEKVLKLAFFEKTSNAQTTFQRTSEKISGIKLLTPYIIFTDKKIFDTVQKLETNGCLKEIEYIALEKLQTSTNLFKNEIPKLREYAIKKAPAQDEVKKASATISEPLKIEPNEIAIQSKMEKLTEINELSKPTVETVPTAPGIPVTVTCNLSEGQTLGFCSDPDWAKTPISFVHDGSGWKGEVPKNKEWKLVIIHKNNSPLTWEKAANRRCNEQTEQLNLRAGDNYKKGEVKF